MIHFLVNISQILANRNVHHSLDDIKKEKSAPLPTKRGAAQSKSAASFKYPWRHSLQSGTSAFHGSCRTGTAKLRSRVCRGGESCMRSFFACCAFVMQCPSSKKGIFAFLIMAREFFYPIIS